jgi:hypothetical protein
MPRPAVLLVPPALVAALVAAPVTTSGCGAGTGCTLFPAAARCDALTCAAACPRDAARDGSGRCVCVEGTLPLLGACVPPAVGDAFCGPAALLEPDGCAFRACSPGARLDVVTGTCLPWSAVHGEDAEACGDAGSPLLQDGRLTCAPSDATCPRGSRRDATAATCDRSPRCPPGSLVEGSGCRAIVTAGGRFGDRRVDVGAWAALVLGFDGGYGSRELCQPLQQNAGALGLPADAAVEITVSLSLPDQDISRVRADVDVQWVQASSGAASPASGHVGLPALRRLVAVDLGTLVEALRGLGGEAAAAAVDLRVRCALGLSSGPERAPGAPGAPGQ